MWAAAHYMTLMNDLAYLGAALGFSAIEIYNAYIEKNKINHDRQASGY
ncbi:dUTP diphosphatase [Bacillus sp. FSL L8-0642]|nr:dUTP diphosphatase [Bacillus wiedmannii]